MLPIAKQVGNRCWWVLSLPWVDPSQVIRSDDADELSVAHNESNIRKRVCRLTTKRLPCKSEKANE